MDQAIGMALGAVAGSLTAACTFLIGPLRDRIRHGVQPRTGFAVRTQVTLSAADELLDRAATQVVHSLRLSFPAMSYSLPTFTASRSELDDAVNEAVDQYLESGPDHESHDEIADHLHGVAPLVSQLAANVGLPDDTFNVMVSGHANPDHGARDGFSPEFISVLVQINEAGDRLVSGGGLDDDQPAQTKALLDDSSTDATEPSEAPQSPQSPTEATQAAEQAEAALDAADATYDDTDNPEVPPSVPPSA